MLMLKGREMSIKLTSNANSLKLCLINTCVHLGDYIACRIPSVNVDFETSDTYREFWDPYGKKSALLLFKQIDLWDNISGNHDCFNQVGECGENNDSKRELPWALWAVPFKAGCTAFKSPELFFNMLHWQCQTKPEQNLLCCKCNSSNVCLLFNYLKSQKSVVAQTNVYSFNRLDFDNITNSSSWNAATSSKKQITKGEFTLGTQAWVWMGVSWQILY